MRELLLPLQSIFWDSRDFRLREKWAVLQCSLVKEPASCSFTFIDIGFSGTLIRSYWTV
jgi:hypothetical protein